MGFSASPPDISVWYAVHARIPTEFCRLTHLPGTCIIGINVGNNPLPDNEHDIASKIAVRMAATYVVYRCPGLGAGGPTSRHRAGGLITVGRLRLFTASSMCQVIILLYFHRATTKTLDYGLPRP